jgi:YfiH family protein
MPVSPLPSEPQAVKPTRRANGVGLITVPDWQNLPWLWHGFSTRLGGVTHAYSASGQGELNLGFTADDDRNNVLRNRQLLAEAVTDDASTPLATIRQIHSAIVATAGPDSASRPLCEGDGLMTSQHGILIGIQTADCVPVLVADPKHRAVAAFHAGWRGTVKRIVESGISHMTQEFGSYPHELVAAIGPAIGPCCYTVGEDLLSEFQSNFTYARELVRQTSADSVPHLDLFQANRRQLLDAGLAPESIALAGACTACHPELFFSHRASRGRTGRMLSVIGVAPLR